MTQISILNMVCAECVYNDECRPTTYGRKLDCAIENNTLTETQTINAIASL